MFARSHGVLHTAEMRKGREGRRNRERERETGTIVIFPARDSARRKSEGAEGGRGGKSPAGTGEASYVRAGGKEEPEEWIEDVRRPVHHLCRPTGIAAGVPV